MKYRRERERGARRYYKRREECSIYISRLSTTLERISHGGLISGITFLIFIFFFFHHPFLRFLWPKTQGQRREGCYVRDESGEGGYWYGDEVDVRTNEPYPQQQENNIEIFHGAVTHRRTRIWSWRISWKFNIRRSKHQPSIINTQHWFNFLSHFTFRIANHINQDEEYGIRDDRVQLFWVHTFFYWKWGHSNRYRWRSHRSRWFIISLEVIISYRVSTPHL